MGSVGSEDPIPFPDVVAQSHGRSFLPDHEVAGTLDDCLSKLLTDFFLCRTDQDQGLQPIHRLGLAKTRETDRLAVFIG
jgi:hypothetical protein